MRGHVSVRTDFPGGNGVDFQWASTDHLRFAADRGASPRSMWFHFLVEQPGCDVLRCEMVRADRSLGWPYAPHVRPVYRCAGGCWTRVAATQPHGETGTFDFRVPCRGARTEIAFCYPYQLRHWRRFFETTLAPAGARQTEIGRSEQGRPLTACELGQGPLRVLVTARAHSGETPGSYALEGILDDLAHAADPRLAVSAIPFLDPDGVAAGMYGKDRAPMDFNRDWGQGSARPETGAYAAYLDSLPVRPHIAVDCHAPTANDPNYIDEMTCTAAPAELREGLARLVRRAVCECEELPGAALCPEHTGAHPGWYPEGSEHSLSGYLQARYGTLAFTLECAYHRTLRNEAVDPAAWRELGAGVARASRNFLNEERGDDEGRP